MNKKALIVEDDVNIAELLKIYLQKDGFDTENVYDGEKALEVFETFRPDIVLLDIMLPKMDGWQVCREIRKTARTPIIMLTAKGESMDKVSGLEMGADDYITKPFEPGSTRCCAAPTAATRPDRGASCPTTSWSSIWIPTN